MKITDFSRELKKRFIAPTNIQFAKWNDWTIVSSFDDERKNFISESVSMGIDKNPEIALMKSLTEFCERHVFKTSNDPIAKLTDRSDGFAAYPTQLPLSQFHARNNAFNEAVERYLWSTWWDKPETYYTIKEPNFPEKDNIKKEFHITNLYLLTVEPQNSEVYLKIILAENKRGGFITGGAAGSQDDEDQTISRAFGELLRHLLVIKRMNNSNCNTLTFYEQRLWGFGSGRLRNTVLSRLNINGKNKIVLPSLVADKNLIHNNSDFVTVHRCLFLNQPIFMGGIVERLCI
ncbi:MAG: hypothetical protein Q7U04_13115 [Bacteriovorax sp.]|nr:hypothetical protein [Bacteriovorax sp.]